MIIPNFGGLGNQAALSFQIRSCKVRIKFITQSILNATVGDGRVAAGITKSRVIEVKEPFKPEYAASLVADLAREVARLDSLEAQLQN